MNMNRKTLERFLGKDINVAVPHWDEPGKLFWYSGFAAELTDEYIALVTDTQIIKVDISKIESLEVRE